MTWRAIHEAHAIDRVRIMLQFNEALNDKLLQKATVPVADRFRDLGFESVARAESLMQTILLSGDGGPVQQPAQNGWVLKRAGAEEAGLRDRVFGYLSTEYGRWENLESRFWDIFRDPLSLALESVNLTNIKLEYWDRFVFDGDPADADAKLLLESIDPAVPVGSIAGATLWHSHAGWFEARDGNPVLINRNFDAIDQSIEGELRRVLNVFTLVDLRPQQPVGSIEEVIAILNYLHNRSLLLFGNSIKEQFRDAIGLDLRNYAI
jgi:uncharacterized protein (TIGR04255 family)